LQDTYVPFLLSYAENNKQRDRVQPKAACALSKAVLALPKAARALSKAMTCLLIHEIYHNSMQF
jgi:hypothetical protein